MKTRLKNKQKIDTNDDYTNLDWKMPEYSRLNKLSVIAKTKSMCVRANELIQFNR